MKILRTAVLLALCAVIAPAFAQSKRVLGKLGQTTAATNIYSGMNKKSRVYYHAKPYEYIVVAPAKTKSWVKVLLQNGAYGYVVAEKVAQLPYEVSTQPSKLTNVSRGAASSRSGAGSTIGSQLAGYALNFIGTPYKWGGNDEYNGIDCSGFVKKMFGKIGLSLPRTAAEQANVGQAVSRLEDLRAGDRLYFWDKKRGKVGHCGIYLGNGYFVHSSSNHKGVATDYLGKQYWLNMLVAARR